MKRRLVAKLIAAAIVVMVIAWIGRSSETRDRKIGMEEYITKKAASYERAIARPNSLAGDIFVALFLFGAFVGSYEIIAFAVGKGINSLWPQESGHSFPAAKSPPDPQ
jgi:hypothetical protein